MTDVRHMTWTLLFEPLGVLLFRDDRPFDAGQHSLATSRFPLPSVFRGAVRTALFEAAGADFRRPNFNLKSLDQGILGGARFVDDHGDEKVSPEAFDIRGPLVARKTGDSHYEYVLPWPQDLVVTRTPKPYEEPKILCAEIMHPRTPDVRRPTSMRMGPSPRTLEPMNQALPWMRFRNPPKLKSTPWLTAAGAHAYMKRSSGPDPILTLIKGEDWLEESDFLDKETRVGIARATETLGARLVATDSMFYTMIAWRMCPRFRFAVEVDLGRLRDDQQVDRMKELLRALQGRLVRLGGKSGHARVEVLEPEPKPKHGISPEWAQPDPAKAPPSSKLWLWTPGLYDPANTPGVTATMGETLRLGGFDMANHCPRPLQSALDRGSVLWFSALDPQALASHQQDLAKSHDLPVSSYGYGHWIPRSNA